LTNNYNSPQVPENMPTGLTAIILAGGLGTRLRSAVAEVPKCLAPVAGKPFLAHVIAHLERCGVTSLVIAAGYRHELVKEFIEGTYPGLDIRIHVERDLLGTGGAIRECCRLTESKHVLVVNGDTLFRFKTLSLLNLHRMHDADCTICLKPMQNFDRYGSVALDTDGRITRFSEKSFCERGLINAGVYCLDREKFCRMAFPDKFSFEQDYLSAHIRDKAFFGDVQDAYFIDIGIPEDYARANIELIKNHDRPEQS
jgi:D-glycero-alpha-D-manno-heptose 1-phosphate guanylyltransferase